MLGVSLPSEQGPAGHAARDAALEDAISLRHPWAGLFAYPFLFLYFKSPLLRAITCFATVCCHSHWSLLPALPRFLLGPLDIPLPDFLLPGSAGYAVKSSSPTHQALLLLVQRIIQGAVLSELGHPPAKAALRVPAPLIQASSASRDSFVTFRSRDCVCCHRHHCFLPRSLCWNSLPMSTK